MKHLILLSFIASGQFVFGAVPKNLPIKKDRVVLSSFDQSAKEKAVYSRFLKAYQKEDLGKALFEQKALVKSFPLSIYADNVVYFTGILYLKKGAVGEALKKFNQVLKEYPKGNKRVSALFAKSIAYKRLNLNGRAKKYFKQVIKKYPGSTESQRAWMELRLLKSPTKTKS